MMMPNTHPHHSTRPRRARIAAPPPRTTLRRQIEAQTDTFAAERLEQLTTYGLMLARWNRAYNLISPHTVEHIATRHILDALLLAHWLPNPPARVLDVGTGGGLPGLPLAITHPKLQFTLLDRNHKKTRFVRQVALELDLPNVTVVTKDLASYQDDPFACIMARAVAPAAELARACAHLCALNGQLLLPQGPKSNTEVPDGWNECCERRDGRTILILQHLEASAA